MTSTASDHFNRQSGYQSITRTVVALYYLAEIRIYATLPPAELLKACTYDVEQAALLGITGFALLVEHIDATEHLLLDSLYAAVERSEHVFSLHICTWHCVFTPEKDVTTLQAWVERYSRSSAQAMAVGPGIKEPMPLFFVLQGPTAVSAANTLQLDTYLCCQEWQKTYMCIDVRLQSKAGATYIVTGMVAVPDGRLHTASQTGSVVAISPNSSVPANWSIVWCLCLRVRPSSVLLRSWNGFHSGDYLCPHIHPAVRQVHILRNMTCGRLFAKAPHVAFSEMLPYLTACFLQTATPSPPSCVYMYHPLRPGERDKQHFVVHGFVREALNAVLRVGTGMYRFELRIGQTIHLIPFPHSVSGASQVQLEIGAEYRVRTKLRSDLPQSNLVTSGWCSLV